ncbi:MAG: extracellular solute-binding protein [Lachnospiraceae bacterium]|nr:extracellular solute-binding protein [Lachnospiraceae bacterium]
MKRNLLTRAGALLLVAGLLAGCGGSGGDTGSSTAASQAPAEASTAAAETSQAQAEASQPEETTEEPAEQITLRVYDWSDAVLPYREKFHEEFMKNNPDIIVEYTQLTIDQFNSTVVTAIASGEGPDLFPVPTNMNLTIAVNENWFLPMEDYVSQEFIDSFVDGILVDGLFTLNGHLYTVPEAQTPPNTMFYYNKDILEACNLEVPTTFEEFREACRIVTEQGNGEYWGLIEGGSQANRCDILLRAFIQGAGGKIANQGRALTVDGKAPYDTPEVEAAVELLAGIVEDGSLYPDTASINAPEARELFGQGKAAFLCQGIWCIGTWGNDHPELNYGVMAPPKNSANGYAAVNENQTWMGIYSQTKYPEQAARYLEALYDTENYTYQSDVVGSGSYVSPTKGVNEVSMTNPVMLEYYDAASECINIPLLTQRDPVFYDFYATVQGVDPSFANIAQGILSQALDDPMDALRTLTEAETAAWQAACDAIGVDFSDMEFENWEAGKDYTEADYANLP